jgi:hypothetical protein
MTKSVDARRKVGPNIVRAWFDTVINPLLRSLTVEQERLERKDWTWRFIPGGLEAIRPVHSHLDIGARDNLEQFLQLHSAVNLWAQKHDQQVALLSQRCEELQRKLQHSPQLLRIYERTTSPEALSEMGGSLREIFGAYPPQDHLALLAQYIVNNTGTLPEYHTTGRLWNKHKDEFLAVLRDRPIVLQAGATTKTGEGLLKTVGLLFRVLKETRLKLSLEHDVPYVAASGLLSERVL